MTTAFEKEKDEALAIAEKAKKVAKVFSFHATRPEEKKLWETRINLCNEFIANAKKAKTQFELQICYTAFIALDPQSP